MSVRKRGSSYLADFMWKGKRYRETFRTEVEAQAWEAQARADLALGKTVTQTEVAKTRSLTSVEDLVRHTERRYWSRLKSGDKLAHNAKLFSKWVGPNKPIKEALEEDLIEDYLTYRETELGNSGSTANRHRASISKLATVALKLGLLDRKPDVAARPEGQARDRVFSPQEEQLIISTAKMWGYSDEADLFAFLCDTGCRLGEVEQLQWSNFLENGLIEIPSGITKNSKGRIIGATKRVLEIVERQKLKRQEKGPFTWHHRRTTRTLWDRLRGHFDWMDENTVLHTFRHTCASRLVQKTGYLDPVTRWLGHSSPQMTMRYAKYAPKNYTELAQLLEE